MIMVLLASYSVFFGLLFSVLLDKYYTNGNFELFKYVRKNVS